jgi:large subunit ribosomal protein L10
VLAEYRGITVGDLTKLRAKRVSKGYLRVLKNTLARRAVEGTPFAPLAEQMTGPLIYGISEDAVAAAKVVNDFARATTSWSSRLVRSMARCWTRLACKRWQASRAAKNCSRSCCSLCNRRCRASRALAALAEKKQAEAAKRTCISVIDRWLYPNSI